MVSERVEYAFSVMAEIQGITDHEVCLVTSDNIKEELKYLELPDTRETRYAVAKRIVESDMKFRCEQIKISPPKILGCHGTLVPISPTILNPMVN